MTDVTQGQDAQADSTLFSEATNAETLEKFENPPLPAEPPAPKEEPKPEPKPEPSKPDDAPSVPSGRFREESDARRRAERERDELMRRIEAMQQRQPQPPQQQIDMFTDPEGFIRQQVAPYLEQMRADAQNQREATSLNFAIDRHTGPVVQAARQALEQGMASGDPQAWGTYNRAMQSYDPYGVIVRAYRESEQLREIGGDLEAYKKRVREEALADPEYLRRAEATLRSQAAGTPGTFRPAGRPAPVASSPSLGDIGASGGETAPVEPSDEDLFRAATRAKRR